MQEAVIAVPSNEDYERQHDLMSNTYSAVLQFTKIEIVTDLAQYQDDFISCRLLEEVVRDKQVKVNLVLDSWDETDQAETIVPMFSNWRCASIVFQNITPQITTAVAQKVTSRQPLARNLLPAAQDLHARLEEVIASGLLAQVFRSDVAADRLWRAVWSYDTLKPSYNERKGVILSQAHEALQMHRDTEIEQTKRTAESRIALVQGRQATGASASEIAEQEQEIRKWQEQRQAQLLSDYSSAHEKIQVLQDRVP